MRSTPHSFFLGLLWPAAFWLLLAGAVPATWAETAEQAATVIRAAKGPAIFQQLVEIRGERGEPDPPGWFFTFNDSTARGGIREIVVQDGQILSERTPVRNFGGIGALPTLPANVQLNTRAVFRTANTAALRQNVGFNWIDYTLRQDALTAEPIWFITLTDYMGARVGTMELRATDLTPRQGLILDSWSSVEKATTFPRSFRLSLPEGGLVGQARTMMQRGVQSTRRGALNLAGTIEEVLFGERTITPEE